MAMRTRARMLASVVVAIALMTSCNPDAPAIVRAPTASSVDAPAASASPAPSSKPRPAPNVVDPRVALLEAIAHDIEALAPAYPQLAGFRTATCFDATRLTIVYDFHTHPPRRAGGWAAAVPNPDSDGIWFYIDLHDPESSAQIHTQPVTPMIDVLGQRLMMLVLEGDRTAPVAGELRSILERRRAEAGGARPTWGH
jgi:hypothetical protein